MLLNSLIHGSRHNPTEKATFLVSVNMSFVFNEVCHRKPPKGLVVREIYLKQESEMPLNFSRRFIVSIRATDLCIVFEVIYFLVYFF